MEDKIPFMPGMRIGRTWDLRTFRPGVDMIQEDCITETRVLKQHESINKYAVIKTSRDVNSILDFPAEISLRTKVGVLQFGGIGSYLREDVSKENTLEILAVAHVETLKETLKGEKPITKKNITGSHYINSVVYGGDLVASILIKAPKNIRVEVEASLQQKGIIDSDMKLKFKEMYSNIKNKSEITIRYYSTVEVSSQRNIDDMLKTLDTFKDLVLKQNDGKGVPLRCGLLPLYTHGSVVHMNHSQDLLERLEKRFDDIRQTKIKLKRLLVNTNIELPKEQNEKAKKMEETVQNILTSLKMAVVNLGSTKETNSQIQTYIDEYDKKWNKKNKDFLHEISSHFKEKDLTCCGNEQMLANIITSETTVVPVPKKTLNIILLYQDGAGKSSIVDSILGKMKFSAPFSSDVVKPICQVRHGVIEHREINLVDTPGILHSDEWHYALRDICSAINFRPDGFHAFLLVLHDPFRFTVQVQEMKASMLKHFGKNILEKYTVLVFTHGDLYKDILQKDDAEINIKDFIRSQGGQFDQLAKECNYRCVLINNREENEYKRRDQVEKLLDEIDNVVRENNGMMYTNELFRTAKIKLEQVENEQKKKLHTIELDRQRLENLKITFLHGISEKGIRQQLQEGKDLETGFRSTQSEQTCEAAEVKGKLKRAKDRLYNTLEKEMKEESPTKRMKFGDLRTIGKDVEKIA